MLFIISLAASFAAQAAASGGQAAGWLNPQPSLTKVGVLPTVQDESHLLNNVDCSSITYRFVASSTMQTGCFTPTAFGLMNDDNEAMIFNGTDEAVTLHPHTPHGIVIAGPDASELIDLEPQSTDGDYIGLYTNPLGVLQDEDDYPGEVTGKRLTAAPDRFIKGTAGQFLTVNSQTLAFSPDGRWLVVESLDGSFVRIDLATLTVTPFAPNFRSQGSPALYKSQVAVSDDGRFVAINNEAADSFKVYDLSRCGPVIEDRQPVNRCQAYEYRPFVEGQISGLQSIAHVRFINDGLISFRATADTPAANGSYELRPADATDSAISYLGLGDSYTSGEGAFDYLAGTDTPDNSCHLSRNSYPLLLSRDVFGSGGHSVACSGAVINDVASTSSNYRGQVKGGSSLDELQQTAPEQLGTVLANFSPGYVAQQLFVRQYQPQIVSVSIGGNDIGFGDILQACVEPHLNPGPGGNTCYSSYEDRLELTNLIDRTMPRWIALYQELQAADPGVRLYAIGYPQIALAGGNCGLNVHLNQMELTFADQLIDYLDNAIHSAAATAGVPYLDISQALAGHRLCEASGSDIAMNGLTAGNDTGIAGIKILGKESYHPNALGQSLIEQAILRQTQDFAASAEAAVSAPQASSPLLSAPKTGQPVVALVPADNLTNSPVLSPGNNLSVAFNGSLAGLKAKDVYALHLDGAQGPTLAELTTDDSSQVSGQASVPVNIAAGSHSLDLVGHNQLGALADVRQQVYLRAAAGDADGDGVADSIDSCPMAANSGQDSDHDGVDDACDGFIGIALGPSAGSNGQPAMTDGLTKPDTGSNTSRSASIAPAVTTGDQSVKRNAPAQSKLQNSPVTSKKITVLGASTISAPTNPAPHITDRQGSPAAIETGSRINSAWWPVAGLATALCVWLAIRYRALLTRVSYRLFARPP